MNQIEGGLLVQQVGEDLVGVAGEANRYLTVDREAENEAVADELAGLFL